MICDIHHHVVYGVDDGSQSLEMSVKMLEIAHGQGVSEICCSSHTTPGYSNLSLKTYMTRMAKLREEIDKRELGIKLVTGCEIMYTEATPEMLLAGEVPTLGDTQNVLIEFMPSAPFDMLRRCAIELTNAGYHPVFAHVERYDALREQDKMLKLKEYYGVRMQMNARTVLGTKGLFGDKWAKQALKNHLIDLVGSDAHNTSSRKCVIGDAYAFLKERYGEKTAKRMCVSLPRRLLHEQASEDQA